MQARPAMDTGLCMMDSYCGSCAKCDAVRERTAVKDVGTAGGGGP